MSVEDWDDEVDVPTCIEAHTGQCTGPAKYRESLSGTGTPIPRCDGHWSKRLDKQAEIVRRYDPFGRARW